LAAIANLKIPREDDLVTVESSDEGDRAVAVQAPAPEGDRIAFDVSLGELSWLVSNGGTPAYRSRHTRAPGIEDERQVDGGAVTSMNQ
jgi:hypothetical protein